MDLIQAYQVGYARALEQARLVARQLDQDYAIGAFQVVNSLIVQLIGIQLDQNLDNKELGNQEKTKTCQPPGIGT